MGGFEWNKRLHLPLNELGLAGLWEDVDVHRIIDRYVYVGAPFEVNMGLINIL